MKLKGETPAGELLPQGIYQATLANVDNKKNNTQVWLCFLISVDGQEPKMVKKSYPANLNRGSTLKADLEVLNGSGFTDEQIEDGVEPETFRYKPCSVVVGHKAVAGGRLSEVVTVVLPQDMEQPEPDAEEQEVHAQVIPSAKKAAK